jgi:phosphatidylinositol alpha-1,6-mannosyltransferase
VAFPLCRDPLTRATSTIRVLLSAQFLSSGNGGICTVARMTATTLSYQYAVKAIACQDDKDHYIGHVPVRAFSNNRIPFVLNNVLESQRATHVVYDFAGTARAHFNLALLSRPYAVWVHGWEIWGTPPPAYLRAIAGATLVLSNSSYTVERAGCSIRPGTNVRVCPLGTPEDAPPATIGPSDGPPTVMLLGRADELFAKGHDLLIDVWPQVRSAVADARLLLVGGGSALSKVRDLAAASPAHDAIEIAGFVPERDLDAYWKRATIFAMPGFAEGFGLVYAEAMRRGVPVVASTNDGGERVNVDGITGFNVPRSDKKRLAEVLIGLLRDRDLARSLGAAGHARWRSEYAFSVFMQRFTKAMSDFLAA